MSRFAPALLLLAVGCSTDPNFSEMDEVQSQLRAGSHSVLGTLPYVGGFERGITESEVIDEGDGLKVHLDAVQGDWVMLGGGFEDDYDLPEGEWVELHAFDHWFYGCSGPATMRPVFDEGAVAVRVRKDTDEQGEELSIVASFGNAGTMGVVVRPELDGESGPSGPGQ